MILLLIAVSNIPQVPQSIKFERDLRKIIFTENAKILYRVSSSIQKALWVQFSIKVCFAMPINKAQD